MKLTIHKNVHRAVVSMRQGTQTNVLLFLEITQTIPNMLVSTEEVIQTPEQLLVVLTMPLFHFNKCH